MGDTFSLREEGKRSLREKREGESLKWHLTDLEGGGLRWDTGRTREARRDEGACGGRSGD